MQCLAEAECGDGGAGRLTPSSAAPDLVFLGCILQLL